MVRIIVRSLVLGGLVLTFACAGKGGGSVSDARQGAVVTGLITASQVDITGDDGSLLADRLTVGDIIYIVSSPKGGSRSGWVRVSRSLDDATGFGWVEEKNIRRVSGYRENQGASGVEAPISAQPTIDMEKPAVPAPSAPAAPNDLPPIDDLFSDPKGTDAAPVPPVDNGGSGGLEDLF